MSTFRIGPVSIRGDDVYEARRPLICEDCQLELGLVWAVAEYSGLPVGMVQRRWPDLGEKAQRHEELCAWSSWHREAMELALRS